MEGVDLQEFDPTAAKLMEMVAATKDITATDLRDKVQLAVVRENRITLKKARVQIEKIGKSLREDAVARQKAVIAKENELIAIIEPEEERLASIEEEARYLAIREEREQKAPARRQRLHAIEGVTFTDDEFVQLDDAQFEAYYNQKVADKNAADAERIRKEVEAKAAEKASADAKIKAEQDAKQAELDAKERALEAEKREIEHKKEVAEAEAKARKEAEQKAREDAERAENVRRLKEEAEKAMRERDQKYQDFLKKNGYTTEVGAYYIAQTGNTVTLYKRIDSITL